MISKKKANSMLIDGEARLEGSTHDDKGQKLAVLSVYKTMRTIHCWPTQAMEIILDLRDDGYDDKQIADALCDGEYISHELADYQQKVIEDAYAIVTA